MFTVTRTVGQVLVVFRAPRHKLLTQGSMVGVGLRDMLVGGFLTPHISRAVAVDIVSP